MQKRKCDVWIPGAIAMMGLLVSCVSLRDKELTYSERSMVETIGSVKSEFISFHFFHIKNDNRIKDKAYAKLLEAGRREYGPDIEIRNIKIEGTFTPWELLNIASFGLGWLIGDGVGNAIGGNTKSAVVGYSVGISLGVLIWNAAGNTQKIVATGDVVVFKDGNYSAGYQQRPAFSGSGQGRARVTKSLETAVGKLSKTLADQLPVQSTIAVLSMSAQDTGIADYILDEIEYQLVNTKKFKMADRKSLDKIRQEQNFQMSGDVDDNEAVSIGKMLGAGIVITGIVNVTGSAQRISVKALDVQSGEIIAMTREQF